MPNDSSKRREVVFKQTAQSVVLQWLAVLGTLAVFCVMYFQLDAIRLEQSVTLRPYVELTVEDWAGATQVFDISNAAQADETWRLGYWIKNVGKYPARNVRYWVQHTESGEIPQGVAFKDDRPLSLSPGSLILATTEATTRSQAIDIVDRSSDFYRHFYVQYEDAEGRTYRAEATWVLLEYKVGNPIRWHLTRMTGD